MGKAVFSGLCYHSLWMEGDLEHEQPVWGFCHSTLLLNKGNVSLGSPEQRSCPWSGVLAAAPEQLLMEGPESFGVRGAGLILNLFMLPARCLQLALEDDMGLDASWDPGN